MKYPVLNYAAIGKCECKIYLLCVCINYPAFFMKLTDQRFEIIVSCIFRSCSLVTLSLD
jgi:hypothetical protein